MATKLKQMFRSTPAPTIAPAEIPRPPNPGWSHGCAPAGSRSLKHAFGQTITKLTVCTYRDPAAVGPDFWRLFVVLEDPAEMIEIGWLPSEHPIPKITFSYCVASELKADLPPSSTDDFVIYESLRARAPFSFSSLYHLIMRHGLDTCLVSNAATQKEYEEFFSTWILTVLGALYREKHVAPAALPHLGARILQTCAQDKCHPASSIRPTPVKFTSPKANELRDMVYQIMHTSYEF